MGMEKLLPLGLAFIMFAMGLALKASDFTRLLRHPLPVGLGLVVQMLVLPLVAFLLLHVFPMRPEFAVGVMILAASPGGITSNMITRIARGDTALSITLTAVASLAGMFTIPFITALALQYFMGEALARSLPVGQMALKVFAVATLPVLAGMAVHHLAPRLAARMERVARPVSLAVFVLIVLWAFASQWGSMTRHALEIGPVVIGLNVLVMALGLGLATALALDMPQRVAIAIEGGLQNGALGIFVALNLLREPAMMTPSISYALVMNFTAAALVGWALARSVRRRA